MAAWVALGAATLLPERTVATLACQKAEVDPIAVAFGIHARAFDPIRATAPALFEVDPEGRWPKAAGVGTTSRRDQRHHLGEALAECIDLGASCAVAGGLVHQQQ